MNIAEIELKEVLPLPLLHQEDLKTGSESQVWLRDSVRFRRGSYYQLEAESGAGKSSLCAFLYGLRTDYEGIILMDGQDISRFNANHWCQMRREALAYLPQHLMLFPELTVMDNIQIKNRLTGYMPQPRIMQMLEQLGIANKANELAGLLSIGQQQRVAIVRALCQPYSFVLLDEPVSHLDAKNNAAAAQLIASEAAKQGAGIIATSVGNRLMLPGEVKLMKL